MISVQQIADLEARVLRAVELIDRLRGENRTLSAALESSERRTQELQDTLDQLRSGQQEVEQIIVRTLRKLDGLESAWAELHDDDRAEPAADSDAEGAEAEGVAAADPEAVEAGAADPEPDDAAAARAEPPAQVPAPPPAPPAGADPASPSSQAP